MVHECRLLELELRASLASRIIRWKCGGRFKTSSSPRLDAVLRIGDEAPFRRRRWPTDSGAWTPSGTPPSSRCSTTAHVMAPVVLGAIEDPLETALIVEDPACSPHLSPRPPPSRELRSGAIPACLGPASSSN